MSEIRKIVEALSAHMKAIDADSDVTDHQVGISEVVMENFEKIKAALETAESVERLEAWRVANIGTAGFVVSSLFDGYHVNLGHHTSPVIADGRSLPAAIAAALGKVKT